MEQQKMIIQAYTEHFNTLGLSKGVKHYLFNYMNAYAAQIIRISILGELDQVEENIDEIKKEIKEIDDFVANLKLLEERIKEEDIQEKLDIAFLEDQEKFKKGEKLLNSSELINSLLVYNKAKPETNPQNNTDKPAYYSEVG